MKTPIILDIEASGFGAGSYPIEIGLALADGTEQSWLIKPMAHWQHWSDQAQALHGISREQLAVDGIAPESVADQLNDSIRQNWAYSDAWGFDSTWLARLFHDTGRRQSFRLDSVFALLQEQELERWRGSRDEVIKGSSLIRHRASNDAKIIQQTLLSVTGAQRSSSPGHRPCAKDSAPLKVKMSSLRPASTVKHSNRGGTGIAHTRVT